MFVSLYVFHVSLREAHTPLLNINNLIEPHRTSTSNKTSWDHHTEEQNKAASLLSPSTDQTQGCVETPQESSIPLSQMLGGVPHPPAWAGGRSSAYFFSTRVLCLLSSALSISQTVIFSTWQQSEANSLCSFPVQRLDGWRSLLNHPSYYWSTVRFPWCVFSLAPVSSSVKAHECPSDVHPLGFQARSHTTRTGEWRCDNLHVYLSKR